MDKLKLPSNSLMTDEYVITSLEIIVLESTFYSYCQIAFAEVCHLP